MLPKVPPAAKTKKKRFVVFKPKGMHTCAWTVDVAVEHDVKRDIEQGMILHNSIGAVNTLTLVNSWDAMWGPTPYPLVRLPENKATCMICLCTFKEPKKVSDQPLTPDPHLEVGHGEEHEMAAVSLLSPATGQPPGTIKEVQVKPQREADAPTVEMAHEEGEGALQLLQLLSCGHAYHCIDPWLMQKSGRCPYCQMHIKVPRAKRDGQRWLPWRRRE
ncbi:hypothetical protein BN946_scf184910.g26 [Trametes cinnabarina]|uniref:RING-type domain-containing protein n=1 Tax=Pycnoporus cinnabarinus TaxID=5643 RepID=A0A060SAI4_PYCCI|nr:hypothetical protein BN946_scf184910.g26 [Trametes cinnabarina]